MKRTIKYLSSILSLVLILMIGMGRHGITVAQTVSTIFERKSNLEEIQNKYVEGQAVVMTFPNVNVSSIRLQNSLFKSSLLTDEFEVEEISDYATTKRNEISLQSSYTGEDFQPGKILLVKSDKYTTKELIEKLKNTDNIVSVEPNYILHPTGLTNDALIGQQWAIENYGQSGGTKGFDMNPIETTGSEEKVIAVIDSGVDYTHEDLKNVMWQNKEDNSLGVKGACGYDFGNKDADPMDTTIDRVGHGTHVAGIIAAEANNQKGITGAVLGAPNIKIMALKTFHDSGVMLYVNAISAYDYISKAQDLGVNIIAVNNSWKTDVESKDESILLAKINEVGEKGALSICGSGNDDIHLQDGQYTVPACLESDYIISVAATDRNDKLASFSNYSELEVDMAAPGVNIISTIPNNKYISYNGTSMSTPFVSAAVGAISNKYDSATPLDIKNLLLQSVRISSSLKGKVATGGTLDLSKLPSFITKPTLKISNAEESPTISNVREIEIDNTETGKTYEYTLDNGENWLKVTNGKISLEGKQDGLYKIKVRIANIPSTESSTYYYNLDTKAPDITVNLSKQNTAVESVSIEITVTDSGSSLKENKIEYQFSTDITAPTSGYQTGIIEDGKTIVQSPGNATGTYYLYVNNIEDKAGNISSRKKFGPYQLKAFIEVSNVTLNKSSLNMKVGDLPQTLIATIVPSNATNKNVTWISSNPSVATVKDGVVTAVKAGTTTITATAADGNKTATCQVTITFNVTPAPDITLTSDEYEIITEGEEKIITYIPLKTTLNRFCSDITTNAQRKEMKNNKGEVIENGDYVGTGSTLFLYKDASDTVGVTYTNIVIGDLTGNGKMADADLMRLARYQAKMDTTLTGAYLRATDVYQDGVYGDDKDLLKVSRMLAGLE